MKTPTKKRRRREIVFDCFAGGGGTSQGVHEAGHRVDVALNHNAAALAMHKANHPLTRHICEDVWRKSPDEVTKGHKVGLATFSPDCRHFSVALGGAKRSPRIRALPWSVVWYAKNIKPRVMIVENVREFLGWGPLKDGKPIPEKKGQTFKRWIRALKREGYRVEWRVLNAADYGVPTHRRRLFIVARCDGQPIRWPEQTHASGADLAERPLLFPGCKPHVPAYTCIDFSLPTISIFEEGRDLVENTMRRVAKGFMKFVVENPRPFIVQLGQTGGNGSYSQAVDEPLNTVTTKNHHCLIGASLVTVNHGRQNGDGARSIDRPLGVVAGSQGEALQDAQLCPVYLVQKGYGERPGQEPRVMDVEKPLGTVVAGGTKVQQVAVFLSQFYGGRVGKPLDVPVPTVTQWDHNALVTTFLSKFHGQKEGEENVHRCHDPADPLRALDASNRHSLAAVYLARFNHGDVQWASVEKPLGVVTTQGNKFALCYAFLSKFHGNAIGTPLDEPMHTIDANDRYALIKVFVETSPGVREPAVMLNVPGLGPCLVSDIHLRMLTPRELARAQGFPESYVLTGSNANQVARIGNSVPPGLIKALVGANYRREVA